MIKKILKLVENKRFDNRLTSRFLIYLKDYIFVYYLIVKFNKEIRYNFFNKSIAIPRPLKLENKYVLSGIINSRLYKREELVSVKLSWIKHSFFARAHTSDSDTIGQVFFISHTEYLNILKPVSIVDGGANVGYVSIKFANMFPDTRIVSIEPECTNYDLLLKNVSKYNNVEVIKAGIWSKEKKLTINNKYNSKDSFMCEEGDGGGENVQSITMNEVFEKYNLKTIDILKMDIEGAEKEVFSNNSDVWLNKVNYIIIETHDRFVQGCTEVVMKTLQGRFNFKGEIGEHLVFEKKGLSVL